MLQSYNMKKKIACKNRKEERATIEKTTFAPLFFRAILSQWSIVCKCPLCKRYLQVPIVSLQGLLLPVEFLREESLSRQVCGELFDLHLSLPHLVHSQLGIRLLFLELLFQLHDLRFQTALLFRTDSTSLKI